MLLTHDILVQAVNLQYCDVYSYKGDGEMDPLSTSYPARHFSCARSNLV